MTRTTIKGSSAYSAIVNADELDDLQIKPNPPVTCIQGHPKRSSVRVTGPLGCFVSRATG